MAAFQMSSSPASPNGADTHRQLQQRRPATGSERNVDRKDLHSSPSSEPKVITRWLNICGLFKFDAINLPSSRRLADRLDEGFEQQGRKISEKRGENQPYELRYKLGQIVYWSPDHHYEANELSPYRQIADEEMDTILELSAQEKIPGAGRFDDIVSECVKAADSNPVTSSLCVQEMANFYRRYSTPPEFVDWQQLQRGINVFLAYAPAAATSLYYRSLIGGFSIPVITAVLYQTRYLAPPSSSEKVRERLMDTGGFIASCMSPDSADSGDGFHAAASLRPGGKGWEAALRVRALHARVRRSILNSRSANWDTAKLGVPINEEDIAATLLAFSINVTLGIEFIAGSCLSETEQRDYLALWRYLGWLLGVGTEVLVGGKDSSLPPLDPCGGCKITGTTGVEKGDPICHASSTLESIIFHLMAPDDASKRVVAHLLNIGRTPKGERMEGKTKTVYQTAIRPSDSFAYRYRAFMCRRFLGETLSNELDLFVADEYSLEYGLMLTLSTIHLMLMRLYTLAAMKIPFVRKKMVNWHAAGMKKFLFGWTTAHGKRMDKAHSELQMKGNSDPKLASSACPFSMVMSGE